MKKIITLSISILLFLSLAGSAAGDSGAISPDYEISEPGQNAVIGWNETHEKLILSTDFRNDDEERIKAVRVIPFPSLPSVKKSDDEVFEEVDDILSDLLESREGTGDGASLGPDGPGGDVNVEWSTEIGSHNLTAYQVNSSQVFGDLVKSKFKSENVTGWEMDEEIETVIKDYLERDLNYFVVDIVDLEDGGGKVAPLLYEFPTDELYYPLLISSLSERVGDVRLAVFSKKMMDSKEFEKSDLDLEAYTWLSKGEVKDVSKELSGMFEKDKIGFTYFGYFGYNLLGLRDISTSSYKDYPRKPDYIPFLAAILFVGISAVLIWYELKYKVDRIEEGGGS